jgi:hypothetical protein
MQSLDHIFRLDCKRGMGAVVLGAQREKMEDAVSAVLGVVWLIIAVVDSVLLLRGTVPTKRRWHPRLVIGSGVVFWVFMLLWFPENAPWPARAFFLLAVPGIILLSLKQTKFCSSCGSFLRRPVPWAELKFCAKCGTEITP